VSPESPIRILVGIVSYGWTNDRYLSQLVREYRSMSFHVDIVVFTNAEKEVEGGVELQVGIPSNHPWALPFAHKKIFAQRVNDYDLFIYSEDDVLITERNIRAFLKVTQILPADVIAGFIRYEEGKDGTVTYPEVHGHFHWEPESVQAIGEHQFARFTNEHSACYVVTRDQLRRAIASKGFLVERWSGKYDLICTAATDPYLQCGFQRWVCISHLDEFLVHHLSEKYSGTGLGINAVEMKRQVDALLRIGRNGHRPKPLFQTESRLRGGLYSKGYYEPARADVISEIPQNARNVLSVGCGWGAMEVKLASLGKKVVAVPLDPVIPGGAENGAFEIVEGDLIEARQKLEGRQFDCILFSNVLHLVADPAKTLASYAELLTPGSTAVIVVPNLLRIKERYAVAKKVASYSRVKLPIILMKMPGDISFKGLGNYEATGVGTVTHQTIRDWSKTAGLKVERTIDLLPDRAKRASRLTFGILDHVFADEIIAVAKRF
jgi:SAM-dependent methyltransferase